MLASFTESSTCCRVCGDVQDRSISGSRTRTKYGYDPNTGRMNNYTFTVGSTPKSQVGTLNWNANGTLQSLQITDGFNSGGAHTCNYKYDELARLGQFNTGGTPVTNVDCGASVWQQAFQFDAFDNLTKTVPPGGTGINWMPGYNQANNHYQLGGTSYDANGNLTNDSFNVYTWNLDSHPISINTAPNQAVCGTSGTCLTYDALGRMVEKNASGTYRQILYSPIGKTAIMNGQTFVSAYIPLPGGQTLFATPTGQSFWYKDWLGTVRLSSSRANRTFDFDRAFAPYGEMYKNFGSTANQNFTGDTQDTAAGLFDTPNRELHPNQGRWISPDPAHAGWNLYAYGTNPLSSVDPSGMAIDFIDPKTGSTGSPWTWGWSWVLNFWGWTNEGRSTVKTGPEINGVPIDPLPYLCGQGESMCVRASDTEWKTIWNWSAIFNLGLSPIPNGTICSLGCHPVSREAAANAVDVALRAAIVGGINGLSMGLGSALAPAGRALVAVSDAAELTPDVQEGTQLFRVFGGESRGMSPYWTTIDPSTVEDYRTAAGLYPGNSGGFVAEGTLNNTEGVLVRMAAPGPGGVGGTIPEVYVPNPFEQIAIRNVGGVNPPF